MQKSSNQQHQTADLLERMSHGRITPLDLLASRTLPEKLIELALQGVPIKERRQRVMKILEEVGLENLADRRPDELSGGQQQRVAIARAIAPKPAIILADEPTANVDSATASGLLDLMENLNSKNGITFLFSTHDQRVMDRARRLIELKDGKIANNGVPH